MRQADGDPRRGGAVNGQTRSGTDIPDDLNTFGLGGSSDSVESSGYTVKSVESHTPVVPYPSRWDCRATMSACVTG